MSALDGEAASGRTTCERVRAGAVTARLPYITARPRYSDHSNGPIAPTILSYVIAETNATVLPASSAHHAQRSPRRNAVAAIAIANRPKATMYMPYMRKIRVM